MPDDKPEDRSEAMEEDLHRLEGHIDEAKEKLADRKEDADIVDDVAGEPEGEQDSSGGDDPSGADDGDAHEQDTSDRNDENDAPGDDEEDEREPDEVANPT